MEKLLPLNPLLTVTELKTAFCVRTHMRFVHSSLLHLIAERKL